jgi:hypothetical protein
MGLAIEVPFNTKLADLDDALRRLLASELEANGFNGVEIAFEAPSREWSAGVSAPTLNLFLYDIREAAGGGWRELVEHRENGRARLERKPLHMDCAYSITAWTRAVKDEHRMLSQALAVLLAHERLPAEARGSLADEGDGIVTRIGRPKPEGSSEFWSALGGQYKLSLDYAVTLSFDPGVTLQRGPEIRTQTVRVVDEGSNGQAPDLHRAGGTVRYADGRPAAGAWLVLPDGGGFATSDEHGRFVFRNVRAGEHRCECRAPAGGAADGQIVVPGRGLDLVLPPA